MPAPSTLSAADIIAAMPRRYWGAIVEPDAEGEDIALCQYSERSAERGKIFHMGAPAEPAYFYYAYPAVLGDPVIYRVDALNVVPVKSVVTITTGAGHADSYIVLRTPEKMSARFTLGVT